MPKKLEDIALAFKLKGVSIIGTKHNFLLAYYPKTSKIAGMVYDAEGKLSKESRTKGFQESISGEDLEYELYKLTIERLK